MLHSTAVTKQWMTKWLFIANAVFRIEKIMVNKVIFVGFLDPTFPTSHIGLYSV